MLFSYHLRRCITDFPNRSWQSYTSNEPDFKMCDKIDNPAKCEVLTAILFLNANIHPIKICRQITKVCVEVGNYNSSKKQHVKECRTNEYSWWWTIQSPVEIEEHQSSIGGKFDRIGYWWTNSVVYWNFKSSSLWNC